MLLTCGSRQDYAIMRQTVESSSVARRSWQPGHSAAMGEAPMEIDAVYGDKGKKGKHARARTRAQESTRVNTRAVAIVLTVASGDTSKETVDTRTLLPKWMEESVEYSSASSSTTKVTPPPLGLSSVGIAQSTTR